MSKETHHLSWMDELELTEARRAIVKKAALRPAVATTAVWPWIELSSDMIEAHRRQAVRLRTQTLTGYLNAGWRALRRTLSGSRRAVAGRVAVASAAGNVRSAKLAG